MSAARERGKKPRANFDSDQILHLGVVEVYQRACGYGASFMHATVGLRAFIVGCRLNTEELGWSS